MSDYLDQLLELDALCLAVNQDYDGSKYEKIRDSGDLSVVKHNNRVHLHSHKKCPRQITKKSYTLFLTLSTHVTISLNEMKWKW